MRGMTNPDKRLDELLVKILVIHHQHDCYCPYQRGAYGMCTACITRYGSPLASHKDNKGNMQFKSEAFVVMHRSV